MSDAELAALLRRQEAELVFTGFDENAAFAIGNAIRESAAAESLPIVCDIRLWHRLLFAVALPGASAANWHWARRKSFAVERWNKASYRLLIDNGRNRRHPDEGADPRDYALHGGAFPILIAGVGAIGTITVSGLPEVEDHRLVVEALCGYLGRNKEEFALRDSA